MFVHVAKDFMKKLDDLESRLSVSMDKDEIHTLGLKLRFYHNEIRNYSQRMREIHERITGIQRKYGFKPEDQELTPETDARVPAALPVAPPPPPVQDSAQDAIKLLADWVMQLQKQGHSPQEALAKARDYIREGKKAGGINITLPEESAAALMRQDTAESLESEPETDAEIAPESEDMPLDEELLQDLAAEEIPVENDRPAPVTLQDVIESVERHAAERSASKAEPEADRQQTSPAAEQVDAAPEEPAEEPPAPEPEVPEHELPLEKLVAKWEGEAAKDHLPADMEQRLETLLETRRAEIIEALEVLALALKQDNGGMNGRSAFLLLCLGWFAHRLAREGLAITIIEKSMNMGCAYAQSFLVLGRCFQEKRICEKALINYKFASKLDGDMEPARLGIAQALLCLNRHEEALDYLADQSFDSEDNQVESILLQSQALEKLDRLPVAVDLLEQTVQNCRSTACTAACLFRLGAIKEKQKDLLKAIDLFEETVESDPDHLEARFTLGRLYMAHKAVPLARKHLYYLTRNHPDSKWADKARELV